MQDKIQEMFGGTRNIENGYANPESDDRSSGTVVRLAAKAFDAENSKPSSKSYSTRKGELTSGAHITKDGVEGDYNHYRTVALKSTNDRAVSLLTNDVMTALRSQYPEFEIEDGDLGENLLVDGVPYDYFQIGRRYMFISKDHADDDDDNNDNNSTVIVEITQKVDPCANLCKLSYINDNFLQPKQRISRCQDFLQFLDRYDGYRGWYAKVIQEGVIPNGAKVISVDE